MKQFLKSSIKYCLAMLVGVGLSYMIMAPTPYSLTDKAKQSPKTENVSNSIGEKATEIDFENIENKYDTYEKAYVKRKEEKEDKDDKAEKAELINEDTFKNAYAYSTLSNENKMIYNEMYTAMLHYKKNIILKDMDLNLLQNIYAAIDADNPELFWVNGYSYVSHNTKEKGKYIEFKPAYIMTEQEAKSYQKQIDNVVDKILSNVTPEMSDYDKSKYIYKTLIANVDYDKNAKNNQNIISVFLNHKTVCKGYAAAAEYLFHKLGMECVMISGKTGKTSHGWNAVKLDGNWYYFDITWGNSNYIQNKEKKKFINYGYLNMTELDLCKTHDIMSSFQVPTCNSIEDNYFIKEKRYIISFDKDEIGNIIKKDYDNMNETCDIRFANKKIYKEAIKYLITDSNISRYCKGMKKYYYFENKAENIITFYFNK